MSIKYTVPIPDFEGKTFGYVEVLSFSHTHPITGHCWKVKKTCCDKESTVSTKTLQSEKSKKQCTTCKSNKISYTEYNNSSSLELAKQDFYLGRPIREIND